MAPTKLMVGVRLKVQNKISIQRFFRWTLLSLLCGILAGLASAIFLILLEWTNKTRNQIPALILALPFAGLFIGWIYNRFGQEAAKGNNLILDEIHDPKKIVPFRMAPLILGGTILTHLVGGSAGREGTAVQMGASLSDQLTRFFSIEPEERKILLAAGAGAGFGAAIGAPWAGVIFGMEVVSIGRLKLFAWFECFIASFVGYSTAVFLKAPHSQYPSIEVPDPQFKLALYIMIAGIAFGIAAKFFTVITHFVEHLQSKLISYPPLKPFVGGLLLLAFFYLEGSFRYVGLGIPYIQQAFTEPSSFRDPILKSLFTALTIGSGFKGGEFIPLVYIGTTLGSALSIFFPISFSLLGALGFVAVFAGASNTPIACSLMAMELFGPRIGPYAFLACFTSYYFSGHHGIYKSQKIYIKKHHKLMAVLGWFGKLPRRFLNGNGEK